MERPGSAEPVEVEWQFDAIDLRPVERWLAALMDGSVPALAVGEGEADGLALTLVECPTQRLVDHYVDTDDWRLGRSGYVLRTRHRGRAQQATLKDNAPATDGLRRRLELSEPLGDAGIETLAADGPVGRVVRSLVGNRRLVQVMEVRTRRRPFELHLNGNQVAEVALDETAIDVGPDQGAPVRLRRVEVEVVPACAETLAPLVDQLRRECGLQAATLSKFEAGLLAAGKQVPSRADLGPAAFGEAPTLGEVAYVSLRRSFRAMLDHEPGTRIGEDPEELHDMRVATRHLRAALAQFGEVLPVRAQQLRTELGWLADVLGAARDLDVQIEQLGEWSEEAPEGDRPALAELGRVLAARRDSARAALLGALDTPRYSRLVSGFTTMLRSGPSRRLPAARALATELLPSSLEGLQRSARKAASRAKRSGEPADFHRLRIRCKKLRYALEFVADVYEGETARFRRQLVGLQDVLGRLQDSEVAVTHLRELATAPAADPLPPATIFVMGRLAERYEQEAARLLRELPGRVKLVGGAEWQRLVEVLEKRRDETLVHEPPAPPPRPALARQPVPPTPVPPTPVLPPPVPPPPVPPPAETVPAENVEPAAAPAGPDQSVESPVGQLTPVPPIPQ